MNRAFSICLTRRQVLAAASGAVAAGAMSESVPAADSGGGALVSLTLTAGPHLIAVAGAGRPPAAMWTYNGSVPGPVLRFRQGDRARIGFRNRLERPTTVHWHGIRLPVAMDGVPGLSQPPVPPGGRFDYEFVVPDAGTFWYHPHLDSSEQIGRGLAGALIVDEPDPIRVDRDLIWVLSDWRLTAEGQISPDFLAPDDAAHSGRIGNTVTVNGRVAPRIPVRSGERLRLRLINAASARVFELIFPEPWPWVIAGDGQPVTPYQAEAGMVLLAPGQRRDLVLDLMRPLGANLELLDRSNPSLPVVVATFAYDAGRVLRAAPLATPIALSPNRLPEPELAQAVRHTVILSGGAMGRLPGGREIGHHHDPGAAAGTTPLWALGDRGQPDLSGTDLEPPLFTVARGQTVVLIFDNQTQWPHPMHLHGVAFLILSRNGTASSRREWADTVLLGAGDTVEVAFVADNPGDWMMHCHILEHQETGMMASFRVV